LDVECGTNQPQAKFLDDAAGLQLEIVARFKVRKRNATLFLVESVFVVVLSSLP
jgi:hypothetical protein